MTLDKPKAPALNAKGPNCWQCRHFAVSHVPSSPYACRAMGFQSRLLPALEVLRVDGQFCQLFHAKEKPISR
jgi:hypothetical protein